MSPRGFSELSVALRRLDPEPARGGLCSIQLNALSLLSDGANRAKDRQAALSSQPARGRACAGLPSGC